MDKQPRKRILFHLALPHHFVFFRRVYERLAADSRLDWYWSSNFLGWQFKGHLMDMFPVKGQKLNSLFSPALAYDLLISPIYLKLDIAPRARQRIQIFHGCAIYNCWLKPLINDYDRHFMVGRYMVRRFAEKGFLRPDDPRIRLVGMPKLDPLANGEFDTAALRTELDLDPSLPTILYAPSGIGSSLYSHGLDLIKRVGQMPVNVIVKLHDKTRDFRRNLGDWLWRVRKLRGGRVRVLEGFDIVPYLALADLLITDFSSVANEFLLRDKPIVFLPTPDKVEAYREMWDMEGYQTGVMVHTEAALDAAIEDGLRDPARMSEVRRLAAAEIFHEPGTATDRAVAQTYDVLGLDSPEPAPALTPPLEAAVR